MSLRRYLLSTLLGLITLLFLASALAGYLESRHELEEVFDAQLAQHAKVLRAALMPAVGRNGLLAVEGWHGEISEATEEAKEAGDEDDDWERDTSGHAYENKIAFQLWSVDKKLLARSNSAPTEALAEPLAGYSQQVHGNHSWRVFTLATASGGWIQVAHRDDVRGELSAEIAMQTIWPALLLMPVIALVIVLLLRQAFRPLQILIQTIGSRSPGQLEPLPVNLAPDEIKPLVRSFNALMTRLATAFQQQKRFIADAAHELRTPLAALQVHTDNALAAEGDERTHALLQVKAGIARTNRLVEQLLLLSKLEYLQAPENGNASANVAELNIESITRQLFDELQVLAHKRHQHLHLDVQSAFNVAGLELPLRAMLRNLLDNALRYSPVGSDVTVSIRTDASSRYWMVCDNGPGIAKANRERVFEPFFRELVVREQGSDVAGTGLGLAIAQEAAKQMGASIALTDNQPTGLCVTVRWPPC
ncbi:HAMP domain-containing protein [Permianibacter sp. IMCC34836]|uniref:ATP-binding protein n=1 Tax=Permianibacter fluminis TaxID=2738515 RepID=UPI001553D4CA|nr:ATP-binding protein [Permianibacter fluminis]NQD37679.1 HAMP domain-containing protein [Permianibacter fluminis]